MACSLSSKFVILFRLFVAVPACCFGLVGYYEPWGKDAGLELTTEESSPPAHYSQLEKAAHSAILFHQNVLSKVDGPRSHFRPTSARYTLVAMQKFGLWRGFLMGCDRLMRENGDAWVYRTVEIDGKLYKHDPVKLHPAEKKSSGEELGRQAAELLETLRIKSKSTQ